MNRLVGNLRLSPRNALIVAGVDARHLFEDKASGARDARPGATR